MLTQYGTLRRFQAETIHTTSETSTHITMHASTAQTIAGKWRLWKKPRFLKNKPQKTSKVQNLGFLFFIFWWNFIQIIFNVIFLSWFVSFVIIYSKRCDRENGVLYRMVFLGRNFVSGLICTLKSKKPLKTPKKLFPKNLSFFPSLAQPCASYIMIDLLYCCNSHLAGVADVYSYHNDFDQDAPGSTLNDMLTQQL